MADISRNLLLIALAVRLQRLVKSLPNNHISAERISKKSLAEAYLADGISPSLEGARKTAGRYMDEMEHTFGLKGSESSGFVMTTKFNTFKDMFSFWLERIDPPSKHDKRLSVMLQGIIHAIDNAFTEDPIVIPTLAKQLKNKYGNKNIRDTKEPLNELFDSHYISSWLQLVDADDDAMGIDTTMDPLLLRLKRRAEVNDNADQSIQLARAGRIHVIFKHALDDLLAEKVSQIKTIAEYVQHSHIIHVNGDDMLPYLLYREGKDGAVMLTLRNLSQSNFEDIVIEKLPKLPEPIANYIPFQAPETTWNHFKQLLQ
ncbi:MAG: hypothetical protein JKY80_07550 [Mariprofundaceae bacterium]|nr:hypothetical protein [Mariprofundaceae bacterium]